MIVFTIFLRNFSFELRTNVYLSGRQANLKKKNAYFKGTKSHIVLFWEGTLGLQGL